jgi:hypothetical protein
MENEEKMMTGEESIKIITDMINRTKNNIRQSRFHLLFWGWLIFICSIAEYFLTRFTELNQPWLVWLLVIPGVFVSMIYGFVKGRSVQVHTYSDMINMWTWIGFLIAATILFIVHSKSMETIAPYILMLAGFPTFVSGWIIRFRPLILGGLSFWLFSLIAYFATPSIAHLAVPVAMLTGYLIPGYMLNSRISHDKI